MPLNTTAILVNYFHYQDSIACLESLHVFREAGLKVIIVDNASPNESRECLATYIKEKEEGFATLLASPKNSGFAAGNNIGIKHALEHHEPDFVWLLNSDTEVEPGSLKALIEAAAANPEIRTWGSTVFDFAPPHRLQSAGGFSYNSLLSIPSPIRFEEGKLPSGLYHELPRMAYVSGVSMFVRAEAFREFGLMKEEYFLYYEELELSRQFGGRPYLGWCPDSRIRHKGGGSTGSQNPNRGMGSEIAHFYGNLSALTYQWRYHKWAFPLTFMFRLLVKSLLFMRYGDFKSFRPLLRAYGVFLGLIKKA